MTCRVCGQPISAERLDAMPRTVTCSRSCSLEDQRALRREGARRQRRRKKGAKS